MTSNEKLDGVENFTLLGIKLKRTFNKSNWLCNNNGFILHEDGWFYPKTHPKVTKYSKINDSKTTYQCLGTSLKGIKCKKKICSKFFKKGVRFCQLHIGKD
jgi:hypothetical protein